MISKVSVTKVDSSGDYCILICQNIFVVDLSQYPKYALCIRPRTHGLATVGSAPLLVALDRRTRIPLQRQIYASIRQAILAGRLVPGTRLPPSRALADDLGVSRTTVVLVYEHLETEGYIASRGSAGSFVAGLGIAPPASRTATRRSSATQATPVAQHTVSLARSGRGLANVRASATPFRIGEPATRPLPCSSLGAPRRAPDATVANQSARIR